MSVVVISPTIQEFNGKRYYLCGKYFQRDGERLHVAVWSSLNGPVPPGHHVHHKDEDRSNNEPDNLALLTASQHMAHHHWGHQRPVSALARERAAQWHGSQAGREWHRQHYLKIADRLHARTARACDQCGKEYDACDNGVARFCSNACKTRWRFNSGLDDVSRECSACGSAFIVNKYVHRLHCSKACAKTLRERKKRGEG